MEDTLLKTGELYDFQKQIYSDEIQLLQFILPQAAYANTVILPKTTMTGPTRIKPVLKEIDKERTGMEVTLPSYLRRPSLMKKFLKNHYTICDNSNHSLYLDNSLDNYDEESQYHILLGLQADAMLDVHGPFAHQMDRRDKELILHSSYYIPPVKL